MSDSNHSHAQGHGEAGSQEHEHHSAMPYVVVWLLLLVLTGVTVWTGRYGHFDLGAFALPLALIIASTKSLLVLIIFMHLKEDKGVNRLVVATAFVFVLLLLGIVLGDVATRFKPTTPSGSPFGAKVVLPAGAAHGAAAHH